MTLVDSSRTRIASCVPGAPGAGIRGTDRHARPVAEIAHTLANSNLQSRAATVFGPSLDLTRASSKVFPRTIVASEGGGVLIVRSSRIERTGAGQ